MNRSEIMPISLVDLLEESNEDEDKENDEELTVMV